MRDEEFVKNYEELLDKGYCNCNEMNCIDNNSPRRILNIAKRLQLEENDLLKENRELRKKLEKSFSYEEYDYQVNRNIELRKENQQLKEQLELSEKARKEAIDKLKTLGKFDGENFTRSFTLWSADFNELAKMLDIDKGGE